MADVAVIGILMLSMGFVMWIGQLLTGMLNGAGMPSGAGRSSADPAEAGR
ncbi:hypothetical protein ACFVTE_18640 [Arthrobacter sp. NPDC058097]